MNTRSAPAAPESDALSHTLAQQLRQHTKGELRFTRADRGRYATDASIYQVMPLGVFAPRSPEDVSTALSICRERGVPIVARGAGTSQCGQTVGTGLVLDFSKHLNRVLDLDLARGLVTVEPGLVLDHLNAQLKKHQLWFAVDVSTSAQATLGGMAGNNSCGSRSIAYGNMVHNVAGAQAWLADGECLDFGPFEQASGRARQIGEAVRDLALRLRPEIEAHWPKVLRRVAGYNLDIFCNQNQRPYNSDDSVNLAHLLVGSEGTLALTRALQLRLSELPSAKVLGVVNFARFYDAMDAAQHIVRMGGSALSAVELVDRTMIELSLQNPAFAPVIRSALAPAVRGGQPEAILLVEFSGTSQTTLAPKLRELSELMGDLGHANSVVELIAENAQKALWEVRKAGLNIMMSLKGDGKPVSFIEDCAVPLEHLAEYTDALTQVFAKHGTRGTWYAHASVGTLHVRPILDMRRDGASKMRAIAEEAAELVRRYRGAYSGEHGDGLCRGEWISWQFGPAITQGFAAIKQMMDPSNLLNPQRMVNPPKMDDTRLMRFAPEYRVIPLKPALDWSAWNVQNDAKTEALSAPGSGGDAAGGFAKAVEMCNNNGHCRKFDAGSMCPSYRVTGDEQHLTRGRANTLRLALSGQLGAGGLADAGVRDEVARALDLCVSCKACKRECPTGVDMARMKIEFQHQQRQAKGLSLRQCLVAELPRYAPWAARLAPLLNLRNRWPALAALVERCVGFSARRALPQWQRQHFFNRPDNGGYGASAAQALAADKAVVLFVDTFNGYFEASNAHAALRVLQDAGYVVHVAQSPTGAALCCGRSYLSQGLVEAARARLQQLLTALTPFARKGIAIVGLEPSCLLTLRDEALALNLGEMANIVAQQALTLEEFLAREAKTGALSAWVTKLQSLTTPLLVHGHCHQKAFGTVDALMQVLKLIPGAQPQLIVSSCCGMAGSFGYEAEHYQASMQMAELSLLPALRAAPDAIVVASGTSCRHQIEHGVSRPALHLAQLLAQQLPQATRP